MRLEVWERLSDQKVLALNKDNFQLANNRQVQAIHHILYSAPKDSLSIQQQLEEATTPHQASMGMVATTISPYSK